MSSEPGSDGGDAPRAAPGPPPRSRRPGSLQRRRGLGHTFSSLGNPSYRLLWLAVIFWVAGGHMQTVVRSFLAYELTESAAVLAIITAAQVVPLLALALFGGAVADRVDRRRLLQACQGATLVATLFVAVSITTNTVTWYHLLASGMVHGGVWAFMSPARQGLIKDLVGRRGLANAIALTGAGLSTVSLAAPAVGGLLYAYLGPAGVSYLSAGVVLVSVILIGFIPKQAQAAGDRRANVVDDIQSGLAYMRQDTLLLVIIGTVVATMMLVHPVMTLLPVLTAEVFDRGSDAYGLLVSMLGVGSLVGSLAAAWLGRWRRGLLLVGGNIAAGAALVALASVPLWYAALPIMVVVGLSEAGRRALSQALIMERADDAHQGRVISVYTMSFGLTPIGVLPAGFAVGYIGIGPTIAALGGIMLAVSALVAGTQKRLRELN